MYDLNAIARLAKLIALIGFALPWLVLSCSNAYQPWVSIINGH